MKKIIILMISFFTISNVMAFNVDLNKINLTSLSNNLTNELDATYKIDIDGFEKEIVNDEDAVKLVKSLINITSSNEDEKTKKDKYSDYMYIDNEDGAKTLSGTLFRDAYFEELAKYKITGGYVSNVKTVAFNDDVIAFAYIKDAQVNGKDNEIVFTYWLKNKNGEYKVYYPWITVATKLTDFFNKLAKQEDSGKVVGTSYNALSLSDNGTKYVDDSILENLYENNKDKVVQISAMQDSGVGMYGSGFFINEGVVVTTWSLFQEFLTKCEYMYVNDANGNVYDIDGVVAAQADYDVVILKLTEKVGTAVTFADSSTLKLDDKLFTINSKNNVGFSINYGTFISLNDGRLENLLALSSSEVGSALFNQDGKVVGFNVADQLNSELSYANSTNYLVELQNILKKQEFKTIKFTPLVEFKNNYYLKVNDEKEDNVSDDILNKFIGIGNLKDNITLDLIKSSYKDNILSLRYKAGSSKMLDMIYLIAGFTSELENEGYKLVQSTDTKKVYENDEYEIVIRENFNYLVIVIVEK